MRSSINVSSRYLSVCRGFTLLFGLFAFTGCHASSSRGSNPRPSPQIAAAEAVIDAFYSFDSLTLRAALMPAESAIPRIVYYQGWAKGGNYKVIDRMPCKIESDAEVSCSITVKDDLIPALGIDFNVTDTFHISFSSGMIANVRTSSNDPQAFNDAMEWVRRERPDLIREPCKGFFNGGPTPGDCVRAMVRGFKEFAAQQR